MVIMIMMMARRMVKRMMIIMVNMRIKYDESFDNLHWPPTVCVATRGSKQPRSKVLRGDGIGM